MTTSLRADGDPGSDPVVIPTLTGRLVTLRPGGPEDAAVLHQIMAEPSISQWWLEPEPVAEIAAKLAGADGVAMVAQIGGEVAGAIQYFEEADPMYRHANIDIYLSGRFQGRGAGPEAISMLAGYLFSERGHHRITIDPAAANVRAIACYRKAGFQPVGVMRQYERGADGTFHDGLMMELLRP